MAKFLPKVGDKLYLSQETGDYWVDMVKRPYTVIGVTKTQVTVQACRLVFPVFHYDPDRMSDYYKQFDGQRVQFYDTIAESIEPDETGKVVTLRWAPAKGKWQNASYPGDRYPEIAHFGSWEHQPYLN